MLSKQSSKIPFLVAITLLLIITILLCTPGAKFPKIGWQDKIWFDKWVHIALFMALVLAWCWFFYSGKKGQTTNSKKIFITIAVVSLLYGIAMEIIQEQFIPNRSFEIPDIISDGVGALIGYFISVNKYLNK